jgi:cell division septation protein DedD
MSYQFGHVERDQRIDYVEEPVGDEYYPPRRLWPGALLAVGVMAIFAGGLWFAYHEGTKHAAITASATPDQVPLIRADTDPVKVKPDKAGGMNIPDKDDPLYSLRPGSSPAEHILPPPEAPAPRPIAPPSPPPAIAAPANQPASAPISAPPQVAALPKPAPKPVEPAPTADPAAKPADAAASAPTRIGLASLRSPEEARDEWQRLKRENGDLLGKFTAVAVRADLGDRGIYYRVEAGPVGDRAAAIRLCKALKERGLGCNLVQ